MKESCKKCPFNTKVEVPYSGAIETDIIVVGESPGLEEINQGRPFVGRSGVLLDKLLQAVNVNRESVFIANSCRCIIDKDADSTKNINLALSSCRANLEKAIYTIKPKLIVSLGAYALKQILGKQKIMQNRGKVVYSDEFKCHVLITVHPEYVLRKGVSKEYPNKPYDLMTMHEKLLFSDFQLVKRFFDEGCIEPNIETGGYRKVKTIKLPASCKLVAIDYETSGLKVFEKNFQAISLALSKSEGQSDVILFNNNNMPSELKEILENPNISKIVASRPFEETVTKQAFGFEIKGKIHDVLTMAHLVDENYHAYNLENITNLYTPLKNIKELAEGSRASLAEASEDTIINYNGCDSDSTYRCFISLKKEIEKDKKLVTYYTKFILPAQDLFYNTCKNGIYIDRNALSESNTEADALLLELEAECLSHIPQSIKNKYSDNLKLTRPKLMKDILFTDAKGLKRRPNPMYLTKKTKEPQITEDHLRLLEPHPFIDSYLELKKLFKIKTGYLNTLSEYIYSNGYVHPQTFLHKTVSGRTAIYSPPAQIIPQRSKYANLIRRVFSVEDGWILGIRDLAQSEFRIMGWLAGDQNILGAINNNIDLHIKTASVVNKIPMDKVTKEMRQKAKACIAEGSLVLTNTGLVPIEEVSVDNLVWDGVEWVKHQGVIYKGEQDVFEYDGLQATIDHEVYTYERGKVTLKKIIDAKGLLNIISMGDKTDLIYEKEAQWKGRKKVYDLLNCGPRHCFTVSGKLVSNCSFGFIYGMSPEGFKRYAKEEYNIDYSIEECYQIRDAFFAQPNGYHKLPAFYAYQKHIVMKDGFVRSPLGRKRRLLDAISSDRSKQGRAIRQAINFPISSFSSDLGGIGFFLFDQEINSNKKFKNKVKSMLFIHDSIMYRAKEDTMDEASLLLKDCMCNRSKEYIKKNFGILVGYRIDSDRKQGKSWAVLEEVKD